MEPGLPVRQLIERCLREETAREGRAWRELVDRYDPFVHALAQRLVHGFGIRTAAEQEAEDVAGQVWMRLVQNGGRGLRSFRGQSEGEWRSYLLRIAQNVLRDRLRKQRGATALPLVEIPPEEWLQQLEGLQDPGPDPERLLLRQETGERFERSLRHAWRQSKTLDRDLLICQLHLRDRISAAKIAELDGMGLSAKGVEKVIEKGKRVLQREFGGPGARSRGLDPGGPDGDDPGEHWEGPEAMIAYLSGELAVGARRVRMAHLIRCDRCRRMLLRLQEALLADPSPGELELYRAAHPGGSEDRLLQIDRWRRLRPATPAPRWERWARASAVVAAALVLLLIGVPLSTESPAPVHPLHELADGYPLDRAAPLRLAQEFAPEPSGPTRAISELADDRMRGLEREILRELAILGEEAEPPRRVLLHNALGHLKLARQRLRLAAQEYERALQIDPQDAVALIGAAVVATRQSLAEDIPPAEAAVLLERADGYLRRVAAGPHHERALYNRVQVALLRGDLDAARTLLAEYERLDAPAGWKDTLRRQVELPPEG